MATDEQAQALGLITPHGTDPIRDGDNAIRQNAHVLTDLNTQIVNRLDHLDTLAAGDVDSVNGHTGTVTLTAADVNALPASYTPAWSDVTDTPDTYPPGPHAATHAKGGADELTPESIGAAPRIESGWRDVTDQLINGWTANTVFIRRDGDTCTLYVLSLVPDAATSNDFLPMFNGFYRAPIGRPNAFPLANTTAGNTVPITLGGNTGAFSARRDLGAITGQGTFVTDGPAPGSWPGTPY